MAIACTKGKGTTLGGFTPQTLFGFWGEEGKMRLERKIKDQEEIQGIGRRGAVASGNDGFLWAGYKFSVQFKFGDCSLLS